MSSAFVVASGSVCSALPCQLPARVLVTCGVVSFPCFSPSAVSSCVVFMGLGSESPRESSLKSFFKGALSVSVACWSADWPACDTLEMACSVVRLWAGWSGCISCSVGDGGGLWYRCGSLTMFQAAVSQPDMVSVLSLFFSKVFVNSTNSIGVCSRNCLMCSLIIPHTCCGGLRSVVHSDLLLAVAKTIQSFLITSDVQSLGRALGSWAGILGIALGRACRSIL